MMLGVCECVRGSVGGKRERGRGGKGVGGGTCQHESLSSYVSVCLSCPFPLTHSQRKMKARSREINTAKTIDTCFPARSTGLHSAISITRKQGRKTDSPKERAKERLNQAPENTPGH